MVAVNIVHTPLPDASCQQWVCYMGSAKQGEAASMLNLREPAYGSGRRLRDAEHHGGSRAAGGDAIGNQPRVGPVARRLAG